MLKQAVIKVHTAQKKKRRPRVQMLSADAGTAAFELLIEDWKRVVGEW